MQKEKYPHTVTFIPIRWQNHFDYLLSCADLDKEKINHNIIIFVSNHTNAKIIHDKCIFLSLSTYGQIVPIDPLIEIIKDIINSSTKIIVKNYIEPGNVLISSSQHTKDVVFVGQLGDTHHVHQSFEFAYWFLSAHKHETLYSLSNPMHCILFSKIVNNIVALPPYPIEEIKYTIPDSQTINQKQIGICSSLSRIQYNRVKCVKKLMHNAHLSRILLYNFVADRSSYIQLLRSLSASIIPSLSGQFSPQITFALSQGVVPIIDCDTFRSVYWENYRLFNRSCISISEFIECSPYKLDKLLAEKLDFIKEWQIEAQTFRNKIVSEYNLNKLLCNSQWCKQYHFISENRSEVTMNVILQIVSDVFNNAKKFKQLRLIIDYKTSLLDHAAIYMINQCVLQIPHLSIYNKMNLNQGNRYNVSYLVKLECGISLEGYS